jgi:hypothetical protein
MLKAAPTCLAVWLAVVALSASIDPPIDVESRAKGATSIVVATVLDVDADFGTNEFGDRLILSQVSFQVDETMKGPRQATGVMTLEGGTVGDLSLDVSDMPRMQTGERAVLFLVSARAAGYVPYGRGAGVMKLDGENRVPGTDLTLSDIRAAVQAAQAKGAGQ